MFKNIWKINRGLSIHFEIHNIFADNSYKHLYIVVCPLNDQ